MSAAPEEGPNVPRDSDPNGPIRPRAQKSRRFVIAVTGAKGGVGKSVLAANLGLYLATLGRKVVIVDADAQGANTHALLGAERDGLIDTYAPPARTFPTFNDDPPPPPAPQPDVAAIGPGVRATAIPGLHLWHAGLDEPSQGSDKPLRADQLMSRVRKLEADYIVVDLGSGTQRALIDFYIKAEVGIYVTLPEPTAIENTYRFLRCAFARHLVAKATDRETRASFESLLDQYTRPPAPLDLARHLDSERSPSAPIARQVMDEFCFRMVLNQTRVRADLELGDRMRTATRRRLGIHLDYMGHVDYDDTVWNCVRARRPLLVESPGTKASRSIEKIARRVLAVSAGTRRSAPWWVAPPESHHDLLEIDRGATDEEVRRAYKRAMAIYDPRSLCCYGLFNGPGLDALRIRLEEAYDVLLDPARRRPYELSVFPAETNPSTVNASRDRNLEPAPPAPIITPETLFSGEILRATRESLRVDLEEVSQRTKIGRSYLEAIEDDAFDKLPAKVYVRGFVAEVAKCLDLDPEQVSRTYIQRYADYLGDAGPG